VPALPGRRHAQGIRELVAELEELSLAIAESDPRWNR
jgi:hypothetical protein